MQTLTPSPCHIIHLIDFKLTDDSNVDHHYGLIKDDSFFECIRNLQLMFKDQRSKTLLKNHLVHEIKKNHNVYTLQIVNSEDDYLKSLRFDRDIVASVVHVNPSKLFEFSKIPHLIRDPVIVKSAIESTNLNQVDVLQYIDSSFYKDRELMLKSLSHGISSYVKYFDASLINDRAFLLECVKVCSGTYRHLSREFQHDHEITKLAFSNDFSGEAFKYAPSKFVSKRKYVLLAVSSCGKSLQRASKPLRNDVEVVLTAVKQNGLALEFAHSNLKSHYEIIRNAVKQNGLALSFVKDLLQSLLLHDEALILDALNSELRAYKFLTKSMRLKYAKRLGHLYFPMNIKALYASDKKAHIVLGGRPCQTVATRTSKAGKHGAAKTYIDAIDLFNGRRRENIFSATSEIQVPFVFEDEYCVVMMMIK
ncbi:hypothetical protein C9374_007721 [Naegleria lovaniensis]|uniref:DUF4116 domain-containing protein n=1 Tax=Naegleria lovaniensis TaxID=51637 RepID=A0AA88GI89_NAELO|nr:uncharacterized protein C9374_007721 [Naegleria lovaniensis]KAG2379083.1 hypothetical protein C9374_007721 [Naegleria lovaniensis]